MACRKHPMVLCPGTRHDRQALYDNLLAEATRYPNLRYKEIRYIVGIVLHKLKEANDNEVKHQDGV